MYTIHYDIQYTLYTIQYTVNTLHTIHYTLYNIHYTLYTTQLTDLDTAASSSPNKYVIRTGWIPVPF